MFIALWLSAGSKNYVEIYDGVNSSSRCTSITLTLFVLVTLATLITFQPAGRHPKSVAIHSGKKVALSALAAAWIVVWTVAWKHGTGRAAKDISGSRSATVVTANGLGRAG